MTRHITGTREEWLAARLELLASEKELTRRSDELAQQREALPWVRVDKAYRFETDEGSALLADLFKGRSQLMVYHFMFGPDYKAGCPSCSSIADGFNGIAVHLENHDVAFSAVSRAPLAKLQAYKQRMEWAFPWASSFGSDFNADFNIAFTEEQQRNGGVEYNYRREPVFEWRAGQEDGEGPGAKCSASSGTDLPTFLRDRPGMSAFAREDGVSTIPIRPMRADWTVSGACTSGSTARPRDATRPVPGGGATTNTTSVERSRGDPFRKRQRGRPRCSRLAVSRGHANLRHHGAADECWWRACGYALLRRATCVTVERNGPDVFADECLPFGALADAHLQAAPSPFVKGGRKTTRMRVTAR